ncbi:hypothetical protein ABEF95_011659 [Exophiala dermatitidis]
MQVKTATTVALAAVIAVVQARFGQEQIPIQAIAAVQGGDPGVAQTIAGAAVSDLLAGSNACDKLKRGDQIISELGNGADAVAAAIGIVAAEKNFNPFTQSVPTICDDPSLPATDVLRGITPLIDPDVVGSDVANALSAQTVKTPLDATGKSVADLLAENGFTNFTTQDSSGNTGNAPAASNNAATGSGGNDSSSASTAAASSNTAAASSVAASTGSTGTSANANGCAAAAVGSSSASSSASSTAAAASSTDTTTSSSNGNGASTDANNSTTSSSSSSTVTGADFGKCVPTMKFEGGLGGRPATEFTFLPIDPLCAQGQQEALNPNIITNRICDQLTNVCEANDAAKALCKDAQSQIQGLGTRDKSTADTWNTLLGFQGAVTNPDGGPAEPPAKMRMVRSYRA